MLDLIEQLDNPSIILNSEDSVEDYPTTKEEDRSRKQNAAAKALIKQHIGPKILEALVGMQRASTMWQFIKDNFGSQDKTSARSVLRELFRVNASRADEVEPALQRIVELSNRLAVLLGSPLDDQILAVLYTACLPSEFDAFLDTIDNMAQTNPTAPAPTAAATLIAIRRKLASIKPRENDERVYQVRTNRKECSKCIEAGRRGAYSHTDANCWNMCSQCKTFHNPKSNCQPSKEQTKILQERFIENNIVTIGF
jgi:hypothetical protein